MRDEIGGVFDPRTRRSVSGLAPQPGWRRLDMGVGAENAVRWLPNLVGDTGQTVDSERDTSLLRDTNHPRLILGVDVAAPYVTRMLTLL
jgi:hypothetical protein